MSCMALESIVIPNSVTHIGNNVFHESGLENVVIGDGVQEIKAFTFMSSSLKSVVIGKSVTEIGYKAFSNCEKLESIVIPDSVTHIYALAFSGCSKLKSIVIPNSVTSIDDEAFDDAGCDVGKYGPGVTLCNCEPSEVWPCVEPTTTRTKAPTTSPTTTTTIKTYQDCNHIKNDDRRKKCENIYSVYNDIYPRESKIESRKCNKCNKLRKFGIIPDDCDDCPENFSNNKIFRKIKIPIISICILLLIAFICFFVKNNRFNGMNNFNYK